jgi:GH24 family phage-related lysozyme (muramidase)
MSAIDIAAKRISSTREEGLKLYPYDDKTGLRVTAPVGHISIGFGCNLDVQRSEAFWMKVLCADLATLDNLLLSRAWYSGASDVRQSVFLDIAYNQGLGGLLDYTFMIHYASIGDWPKAAIECSVKPSEPPGVIARYKRLSDILLTGVDNG